MGLDAFSVKLPQPLKVELFKFLVDNILSRDELEEGCRQQNYIWPDKEENSDSSDSMTASDYEFDSAESDEGEEREKVK